MSSVIDERLDVREYFPILQQLIHGKPLAYLDNAATTQKPKPVIDAIKHYYENNNANVHRGVHTLSERATAAYEGARVGVQKFINARSSSEIVFVKGTTEAVNLVAQSYGQSRILKDDEIILSIVEHHSNIVPWQILCEKTGAKIKVIPMTAKGELDIQAYSALFSPKTKFVSVSHVSNAIGVVNPVKQLVEIAHHHGVPIMLDGAQAVPHFPVDVQKLDCDFYAFSSHKMYGPTGIGVLYAKKAFLDAMPPYQGGGDMIMQVGFDKTVYNEVPFKFEAGTPNIAGAVGLHAAINFIQSIGYEALLNHEQELLEEATNALREIPGLTIIGDIARKVPVISFTLDFAHPHDIATILDHEGIAIRAGHHCAMPLMDFLGVPGTARISFAMYNSHHEINRLVDGIYKVKKVMV